MVYTVPLPELQHEVIVEEVHDAVYDDGVPFTACVCSSECDGL